MTEAFEVRWIRSPLAVDSSGISFVDMKYTSTTTYAQSCLRSLVGFWVSLHIGTSVLVDRKTRMPQERAEDKYGIIRRLGQGKRILKLNGLNCETRGMAQAKLRRICPTDSDATTTQNIHNPQREKGSRGQLTKSCGWFEYQSSSYRSPSKDRGVQEESLRLRRGE